MTARKSDHVRVSLLMRRSDYEELRQTADACGETVSGYLRKALATHGYIREHAKSGARIFVELDGVRREVIFR